MNYSLDKTEPAVVEGSDQFVTIRSFAELQLDPCESRQRCDRTANMRLSGIYQEEQTSASDRHAKRGMTNSYLLKRQPSMRLA